VETRQQGGRRISAQNRFDEKQQARWNPLWNPTGLLHLAMTSFLLPAKGAGNPVKFSASVQSVKSHVNIVAGH
jgi:hypothetical protein